jgi:hypothetical protein
MKFLKRVERPWKAYYYIEKFDRNQWNTALIDKKIADFCDALHEKKAPWYFFTSKMKSVCPFEAGTEDNFNMVPTYSLPKAMANFALIGKYRVTFYSYFAESTDCTRTAFEITEFSDFQG